MRIKFLLPVLSIFIVSLCKAACPPGFKEMVIHIIPDTWPQEVSWSVTDNNGFIYGMADSSEGDTICIPDSACVTFTINDTFGDGIIQPGGYWVYIEGILVANGNNFGHQAQQPVNCPPGTFCSSALPLSYGQHAAHFDNTWYNFVPDSSGMYLISTCGLNTCDTKIWVYTSCTGVQVSESPAGSYAFNEDACGLQAELNVMLLAGNTYYIRIGDNMDNCPDSVHFNFSYNGPVSGCMDNTACNFNPLATVDDGSCIYFPDPNCAGPDLEFDSIAFVTSLSLSQHVSDFCDVTEGCVTGYGNRWVIRFSSKINNIGTLDYYIGNPSSNPGMFSTNNCHGHTHYEGYGDYRLIDMLGNPIPAGHKNGFCVMDLCGGGQYTCSDMGISTNCYDVYGAGTQCQWIDITDVPDGDYRLAVLVNPLHLPDALGHHEINYMNNALQVCINIIRNSSGVPSFSLLPNCTPFTDCMGVPGGIALMDCNGICNGPAIFGDIVTTSTLDTADMSAYVYLLTTNTATATTCNDLSGDGNLSIYDAALAGWCVYGSSNQQWSGSHNHCSFPRNILNPSDSASLRIADIDWQQKYIDVEILSKTADIKAYQFEISGADIQSVVSLADLADFPVEIDFSQFTNEVFAISVKDSALNRSLSWQSLCRIYFNNITDSVLCISNITDIVNQKAERMNTSIDDGCWPVPTVGISENHHSGNITIRPNPVSDIMHINLGGFNNRPSVLELRDVTGRHIRNFNIPATDQWFEADLSFLAPGIYTMQTIDDAGKIAAVRFVRL